MKPIEILVIGSVHLDIVAAFSHSGQEQAIDRIGNAVGFSIGGTSLNIAAWLKECGHKPYLLTALNKSSPTGQFVMSALRAGKLSRKHIVDDSNLSDSAFVAMVNEEGQLQSAVSHMSVQESNRITECLEPIVSQFKWVVFDCNLSAGDIEQISGICRDREIQLIGAATSDSKADRLAATCINGTLAVCMNRNEADVLAKTFQLNVDGSYDEELRKRLRAEQVIITEGAKGWRIVSNEITCFEPPRGTLPVNTIGAGDAVCAGLIEALVTGKPIDQSVERLTRLALSSRFPTTFARRTSPRALSGFIRKRRVARIALSAALFVGGIVITWFIESGLSWLLASSSDSAPSIEWTE